MFQDIAIGAGNLRFDSRAGQIGRSVANGSTPLRCFCVDQTLSRRDGPRHSLLRKYIVKLIFWQICSVFRVCYVRGRFYIMVSSPCVRDEASLFQSAKVIGKFGPWYRRLPVEPARKRGGQFTISQRLQKCDLFGSGREAH